MNAIWIVICAIFCALGGYIIGARRGIKVSDGLYDAGWEDAETYFKQHPELVQDIDKMMDDLYADHLKREKYEKACGMVKELGELFDDECPVPDDVIPKNDLKTDENIIDCGNY